MCKNEKNRQKTNDFERVAFAVFFTRWRNSPFHFREIPLPNREK